ncbi:MAG: hypothetical protein DYG94_14335 [Leptolyngbya sp. PLA3]|nr:MAG: hypothetical protein EDM82_13345 [Cyanobacteria bacterium CYA]MCE7969906.1 hypothetical protein [Leptolyngbya sp. PL-A3]
MYPLVWASVLSGLIGLLLSQPVLAAPELPQVPHTRVIVRVCPGVTVLPDRPGFTGPGATQAQIEACSRLLRTGRASNIRRVLSPLNTERAARIGLDRYYSIEVRGDATQVAQSLREFVTLFEVVEIDVPIQAALGLGGPQDAGAVLRPNDPLFAAQWSLENTGQNVGGVWGTPGADVGAVEAWEFTRGKERVIVAVLDSGISFSHPDLAGQLVQGINLTSTDTADVDDPWVSHGTHVAGIIAARQGNGEGITGLAPGCRLMPVKIINRFNWTLEEWLAQGVVWATDHGAMVLNISLGFPSATSLQRAAIRYAYESDVVICASSGNIGSDPIGYPARLDETIAVGATNNLDEVTAFTSTGPALTLCAPGRDVVSTWDTETAPDTYHWSSGTSFSTPHVAAAAALVRSLNPRLTAAQVRRVLAVTCRDLGEPGRDDSSGWGRLDVPAALALALTYPLEGQAVCLADRNGDGSVDFTDLQMFLEAFSERRIEADWNNDGAFTIHDILAYLNDYESGCPQTLSVP